MGEILFKILFLRSFEVHNLSVAELATVDKNAYTKFKFCGIFAHIKFREFFSLKFTHAMHHFNTNLDFRLNESKTKVNW